MTFRLASLLPAFAVVLLLSAPAKAAQAQPNGDTLTEADTAVGPQDAGESGIWGVACDRDASGAKTGCRVTQTVVDAKTGKRLLTVTVRRAVGKPQPAMMVTLPLRTFLTPGVLVRVDDKNDRQTPFQLCDENGCYAGLTADEPLIDALKAGKTLGVAFFDLKRQKTEIRLPLKTFAASFDEAGK